MKALIILFLVSILLPLTSCKTDKTKDFGNQQKPNHTSKKSSQKEAEDSVKNSTQTNQNKKPIIIKKNKKTNPPIDQNVQLDTIHPLPIKTDRAYQNPNLADWEATFGKDPKWLDLYQESVSHFLIGLANRLNQNPQLKINKSEVIFRYGQKMYDLFLLTPEFAEYCKIKFQSSDELQNFIAQHQGQINMND